MQIAQISAPYSMISFKKIWDLYITIKGEMDTWNELGPTFQPIIGKAYLLKRYQIWNWQSSKTQYYLFYRYWYLNGLTTTIQGTIDGATAINIDNVALDVDSRPGITSRPVDNICERGHLTCAPKNLCWACDKQVFNVYKSKSKADSTYVARVTLPGAKLQPFFNNGTTKSGRVRYGLRQCTLE